MNTISTILNKLTQFFSEISLKLGLENWQLLTIILAVVAVLILILRYQRRTKIKSIQFSKTHKRPDTIGARLTTQGKTHAGIKNGKSNKNNKNQSPALIYKKIRKHKSWKKTIKELREITEQTRHLKQENIKLKETEKQPEQKTAEQTTDIENHQQDVIENGQPNINTTQKIEQTNITGQQIAEQITDNSYNHKTETAVQAEPDEQTQQVENKSEQTDNDNDKQQPLQQAAGEETSENKIKDEQSGTKTKQLEDSMDTIDADNQQQKENTENKQENKENEPTNYKLITFKEQSQEIESDHYEQAIEPIEEDIEDNQATKQNAVPLDVKELMAIAELAKRLSGRKQQHQSG
ncbi:MAG: hypothetical protein JW715_17320 [Sedimentisphaerales bacterium]|nr:hypothetical protein [Sedimentisphaerales bacterium]